jgi:hypothetical protein
MVRESAVENTRRDSECVARLRAADVMSAPAADDVSGPSEPKER